MLLAVIQLKARKMDRDASTIALGWNPVDWDIEGADSPSSWSEGGAWKALLDFMRVLRFCQK